MSKEALLDVVKQFAKQYQTKRYKKSISSKGRYIGQNIILSIALDFINYLENLNNIPIILIDLLKKTSFSSDKINELELEILKLKLDGETGRKRGK